MDLKITPLGQTIVKPTALGSVANTDTKLLIYGLFQKDRVLAQDGIAPDFTIPRGVQTDRGAVAETIANNVRSKILREHLHDPAFYEKMSRLLSEVLADLKAKRIDYEEFLTRVATLAGQVHAGRADDTPEPLRRSPGLRAIYNTLVAASVTVVAERPPADGWRKADPTLDRAQRIDASLRGCAPNGWRGFVPKEQEVKRLIYEVVQDTALVERLFAVIKVQAEY